MKNNLFIKTVTLLFFVCCVAAFVMQQSGYFTTAANDQTLQTSHNGGVLSGSAAGNEIQCKRDSVKFQILRSSKSLVIDDEKLQKMIDSRLGIAPAPIDTAENRIFSSSKVLIINPKISNTLQKDTLKPFTARPKKVILWK